MSSTRRATDGGFHQERYCSSEERGLLANIVAKCCESLSDPKVIWWLQLQSHREGIEAIAAELIKKFPDRIGTRSMQRFGIKPGCVYNADQVRAIRKEVPRVLGRFLLASDPKSPHEELREMRGESSASDFKYPDSYRYSSFINLATVEEELPRVIMEMCVNPESHNPWYFPSLFESLRELMESRIAARREHTVVTDIGRRVCSALDYCMASGLMTLIEGSSRTGKSFSAKEYCEIHPGECRLVQVPSSYDDTAFFRALATGIRSSAALSMNVGQLRSRVEASLQTSKLMLVLDEAHYLWPQRNRREALPTRINWIMTALVNNGVPVALISTPQFSAARKVVEKNTGWTSEQFIGRIGHHLQLPSILDPKDLAAVAAFHLPKGCSKSIQALVKYGQASAKYLSAIETAVKRALFLAQQEGRDEVILPILKMRSWRERGSNYRHPNQRRREDV